MAIDVLENEGTAYATLFDYCQDQGWEIELHVNPKSEKGPSHLRRKEQVHGLILYISSGEHQWGLTIPVTKTLNEAAEKMCDKLGIDVPE